MLKTSIYLTKQTLLMGEQTIVLKPSPFVLTGRFINEHNDLVIQIYDLKLTLILYLVMRTTAQWGSKLDNWGGGIFIYSSLQTMKTIDFKQN